jgi:hypothetical protein
MQAQNMCFAFFMDRSLKCLHLPVSMQDCVGEGRMIFMDVFMLEGFVLYYQALRLFEGNFFRRKINRKMVDQDQGEV